MDYEKEYKSFVAKVKKAHQFAQTDSIKSVLEDILPQLRESDDEMIRRTLVEYFGPHAQLDFVRGVPIQKIRDWLEKQKEQKPAPISCGHENGTEWSEEDEKIRKTLLDYYENALDNYTCVEWLNGITYGELCDWLKSLRPVSKESLQPHWKPSEKQIEALNALLCVGDFSYIGQATKLQELYTELKKLM